MTLNPNLTWPAAARILFLALGCAAMATSCATKPALLPPPSIGQELSATSGNPANVRLAASGASLGAVAQAHTESHKPMDLEVTFDLEEASEIGTDGKPTQVARRSITTKIRVSPGEAATLSGISRDLRLRSADGSVESAKETLTFKVLPQRLSDEGARVQFLVVREAGGVRTTVASPILESALNERTVVEEKSPPSDDPRGIFSLRVSMRPTKPKNL